MFLTRIGHGTRAVVTGDVTQNDLPRGQASGLEECLEVVGGLDGVGLVHLRDGDVVRHRLVQAIVRAYARSESRNPRYEDRRALARVESAWLTTPRPDGSHRCGRSSCVSRDWVFDRPLLTGSALALVLALLIWPRLGFRSPVYEVGDIATATVRVSADFTYEDAAATEERRQEALEVVPDVYDFDPQVRETVRARIARGFAFGRQSIEADTASEDAFAESAAREFGVELARDELALLLGLEFRESVERNLTDAAVSVLARDILAEKSALAALGRPIQRQDAERGEVHVLPDLTDVLSIEDAARAARLQMLALSEESGPDRAALAELAQRFIQPTLARNEVATTRSRASAEENVDPVVIQLREGRTLLRAGDEVTEDHLRRLDAMRAFAPVASPWAGVGALLFTSLAAWILFRLYQPARSGRRWMVHGFALARRPDRRAPRHHPASRIPLARGGRPVG